MKFHIFWLYWSFNIQKQRYLRLHLSWYFVSEHNSLSLYILSCIDIALHYDYCIVIITPTFHHDFSII